MASTVTGFTRIDALRGPRTSTGPGTPSTSSRSICRQNRSWVWSSTAIDACICHVHESCTGKAIALPRPNFCNDSTG